MNQSVHERLKNLLEGTHEAFEICGSVNGALNTDYAGFASLSLPEFKAALENPDLTGNQLRRTIRSGSRQHSERNQGGCWATFMADYVRMNANSNIGEGLIF